MPKFDDQTIALACIAIIALAVVLQAIVLLAIFLGLRKAIVSIREQVEDLRSSVLPAVDNTKELVDRSLVLVDQTRQLITRLAPKAESTVSDLARVARGVRNQIEAVEFTGKDILERTRRQTERVDAMTTEALDHVDQAGRYVAEKVGRPVRQLAGILAAAKAIVESLRGSAKAPSRAASYYDEEEPFE
jgi:uncharacterized protein YoxC